MKDDVLRYLVAQLVDHPEDVEISESGDSERTLLTIKVHPEDMGKVIGKSGRIIKSLRDLMKILATKKGIYVDVVLAEEEK